MRTRRLHLADGSVYRATGCGGETFGNGGNVSELVHVRTYFDQMSADFAQALLRAEGIESVVMGDGASGWQSMLSWVNGFKLCVANPDAELAVKVLDAPPAEGS